jgi:hypothetical protein
MFPFCVDTTTINPDTPVHEGVHQKHVPKNFRDSLQTIRQLSQKRDGPPVPPVIVRIFNVSSDVLALKISSYMDTPDEMLVRLGQLFDLGRNLNIKKLIIDHTGNPGGFICLGYEFDRRLGNEKFSIAQMDIIHSDFTEALMENSAAVAKYQMPSENVLNSSGWLDLNKKPYEDNSWYDLGVKYTRGGKTSLYSQRAYKNCPGDGLSDQFANYTYWKFDQILIVSDGDCGSMCAQSSVNLKELAGAKTVGIGGIYPEPMSFGSFPGGQVSSSAGLTMMKEQFNITDPRIPNDLPLDAMLTFNFVETYPWIKGKRGKLPIEFTFLPTDYRLPIWLPLMPQDPDLVNMYEQVAKLFKP